MTIKLFIRLCMMGTILPWTGAAVGYVLEGKYAMAYIAFAYGTANLALLVVGE